VTRDGGSGAVGSAVDAGTAAGKAKSNAWVLHIGDSFVFASFEQNLGPRFKAAGSAYVVSAKTATYTTTWAFDPDLDRLLQAHPSLVLITLGANEADMPVPAEHAGAITRLVERVGRVAPCVWVTPPMWKRDTGILEVIHEHAAPCLFYDSDAALLPIARQKDGIHPNAQGGALWASEFWEWLQAHRDVEHGPWALVPFERRKSSLNDLAAE
jgi:hypothetical protein